MPSCFEMSHACIHPAAQGRQFARRGPGRVCRGNRDETIGLVLFLTEDWRLRTGDWRPETGDWRPETGDWRPGTGDFFFTEDRCPFGGSCSAAGGKRVVI